MILRILLVSCTLMLLTCGPASMSSKEPIPGVAENAIQVKSESGAAALEIGDSAALITVYGMPVSGNVFEHIELTTPQGHRFELYHIAVDASGDARLRFPLRGTFVEEYNMRGAWHIRAIRDGELEPKDARFELKGL